MWRATVGATPVKRWTCAASATFSNGSRGTPCWANTLNRVPEFPKAHDGNSIRCVRSVASTAALADAVTVMVLSSPRQRPASPVDGSVAGRDASDGPGGGVSPSDAIARDTVPQVSIGFNLYLDS